MLTFSHKYYPFQKNNQELETKCNFEHKLMTIYKKYIYFNKRYKKY